nr:protein kinase [Embleya scabrispora]
MDAYDPRRIGPYRVLSRLGQGGMARVFLGLSPAGRLVAIKTILAELDHDVDFRRRFAREVHAARLVSGVFTAAVVAADPEAARPWLATAYVPAPSLREVVDECGPLPPDAVRWLAAGVAEALGAIHGAGLVHRDLAPGNILVTLDGPKVIDFGLALAEDQDTVNLVGTIAYMAPEQIEGESGTVRSDVYAMGATLLFAGTGHAPYEGSAMRVMSAVRNRDPDLTGLPDALLPLVESCLRRRADRRPTPDRVVADFADLLTGRRRPHEAATWLPRPVLELLHEHERRIGRGSRGRAVESAPRPTPDPEPARAPSAERPRPARPAARPTEPTVDRPAPAPTKRYTEDPYARTPMLDRIRYEVGDTGAATVLASSLSEPDLRRWHAVLAPVVGPALGAGYYGPRRSAVRFGTLGGRPTLIRRTASHALVLIAPPRAEVGSAALMGPRHALALGAAPTEWPDPGHPGGRPMPPLDPAVLHAEQARRGVGLRLRAGRHPDVLTDVVSAVLTRPEETFALSEADGVPDPDAVLWGLCDLLGPLLPYPLSLSTLSAPEPADEPRLVVHRQWPADEPRGGWRHRIVPGEELYSMGDVHRAAAEALVRCYTGPHWAAAAAALTPPAPFRSAAPGARSQAVLRALGSR